MFKQNYESGTARNGGSASFWEAFSPQETALYIYRKTGIAPTATLATAVAKACGWKEVNK